MTEQAGPKALVRHAAAAERVGFDFEVISDHYSPWLDEQGHAPYAWSVLGAVTECTDRVELMTYVTCPTMRYHPAVVAQQAATIQLLSDHRFTLGLGSGENLNEHVVGKGWPGVKTRQEMLTEAIDIIAGLFDGGYFNYAGKHFQVDSAKLWDLPEIRTPIGVAVSGRQSVKKFSLIADTMIAVQPNADLCRVWDAQKGEKGSRKVGQLPVAWDPDRDKAVHRAHEQFRWFAGGWKVNAELPGTPGFAGATKFVTEDDVAQSIPCGPEVEPIVESVRRYADAGFSDLALVQIGGEHQDGFFDFAEATLLPALREAFRHRD
jgi:G6PDH family F420-dependent oxidoreductase